MRRESGAKMASADRTVPVLEEELQVGKRTVETWAARVEVHVRQVELRETTEEPVISKQARVKEEVVVDTEASERTEVVRDTLRRTDVEVEKLDEGYGPQVADMGDDEFIEHFNATYGQGGEHFGETYRSAYHFAESESSQPQLRDREWLDVEDDIHRDWERSHPGTWGKVEQAIHFGWDKIRRHH